MSSNRLFPYLAAGAVVGSIFGYILSSKSKCCEGRPCSSISSCAEDTSSSCAMKTSCTQAKAGVQSKETKTTGKSNPKSIQLGSTNSVDVAYPTGGASIACETQVDPHGYRKRQDTKDKEFRGPICIAVAGASGSGKTSIATLLQERLKNIRVVSISSDEYYKTLDPNSGS